MKNKGYANFWGQVWCIMGDVQVAYSLRLCKHDKCWGGLWETLTYML